MVTNWQAVTDERFVGELGSLFTTNPDGTDAKQLIPPG